MEKHQPKTTLKGVISVSGGFLLTLVIISFLLHLKVNALVYDELPGDIGIRRMLTFHKEIEELKSISGVPRILWIGPSYAQDLGVVYELRHQDITPAINLAFPGSSFEQTRKILETNATKEATIIYPVNLWEATEGASAEEIRPEAISTFKRELSLFRNWSLHRLRSYTGSSLELQMTMPEEALPTLEGDQLENIRSLLGDPDASEYRVRVFKKQMDQFQDFSVVATPPYEELQKEFPNLRFLYIPVYPLSPTSNDDALNEAARKINSLEETFRNDIKNKNITCVFLPPLLAEDYEYFDHLNVSGATKCIEALIREGCLEE
jgi:hypothetical protein